MNQNNKTILIITLINVIAFGLAVSPLFEEMNLLRFLIIGFGGVCLICPLLLGWEDKDDEQ